MLLPLCTDTDIDIVRVGLFGLYVYFSKCFSTGTCNLKLQLLVLDQLCLPK